MMGSRFLMDLEADLDADFGSVFGGDAAADFRGSDDPAVPAGGYDGPRLSGADAGDEADELDSGQDAAAARAAGPDRWVEEQVFEEDLRAVLAMMRPNRYERLMGWSEYRTGGRHFRATISWDKEFERTARGQPLNVPHVADVLEAILVGSVKADAPLSAEEVGEMYRDVVAELYRRVDELPGAGD